MLSDKAISSISGFCNLKPIIISIDYYGKISLKSNYGIKSFSGEVFKNTGGGAGMFLNFVNSLNKGGYVSGKIYVTNDKEYFKVTNLKINRQCSIIGKRLK